MLRRNLLVILASILAPLSAHIEHENDRGNWVNQKPFQIIMSWYLKYKYTVTVQVIHRTERDSMHRHSSKLISIIHEEYDTAVLAVHHVIRDHKRFYELRETNVCPPDGNASFSNTSITHQATSVNLPKAEASQALPGGKSQNLRLPMMTYGDFMRILLISDATMIQAFSNSEGFWQWSKVKFMLIIVVAESSDILCQEIPERGGWRKSVRNILERVWSENRLLNIFLFAPNSACIKDYLFAWNPFVMSKNGVSGTLKRLKINTADPGMDEALSEFIISLRNMNGYPLKVVAFERVPTLLGSMGVGPFHSLLKPYQLDFNKITGLDGEILKAFSAAMNCSVKLYPPSNDSLYGWMMDNGTFVGVVGDIVYRRVDFAANGVFLKDYQTDIAAEFTVPISCESMCIVVPRAGMIPQWLQIFQCFSPLVWTMLLFNVVICGLLRLVIRTLRHKRRPRRSPLEILIEMALIFTSSPQNMPKLHSERILVGFYLLFSVIVIGTFQGTLYEGFANPEYYPNPNTLDQLDKLDLPIGTGSPNLRDIFGEDDDSPTLTHLRQKVQIGDSDRNSGTIDRAAWQKDTAAIERKNDVELSIKTRFLDQQGKPVLHIVEECPRIYHMTYLVPSGAFFLRRVNVLLRRMVEAGLITYWYNATVSSLITKHHYSVAKIVEVNDSIQPYNLQNLQTSFIILTCGLLLSILVFIGETVIFRRRIPRGRTMPQITIAPRNFVLP